MKKIKRISLGTGLLIGAATSIALPIALIKNETTIAKVKPIKMTDSLKIKKILEMSLNKDLEITTNLSTITENKNKIFNKFNELNLFPKDLKGTTISVEESDLEIILDTKIPIVLLVSKDGEKTQKVYGFTVKRLKTDQEMELTWINEIKSKIQNKDLIIPNFFKTSDDASLLMAIKTQLKNENPDLTNADLSIIEDNITSLNSEDGIVNNVNLLIGSLQQEKISITVTKKQNIMEINKDITNIKELLQRITYRELSINSLSGTIESNKEQIFEQLQLKDGYPMDLKGTTIAIKPGQNEALGVHYTEFTLIISKEGGVTQELNRFRVKREGTNYEILKNIIKKIQSTTFKIDATSGTIDNNKIEILEKLKESIQEEHNKTYHNEIIDFERIIFEINDGQEDVISLDRTLFKFKIKDSIGNFTEFTEFAVSRTGSLDYQKVQKIKDKIEYSNYNISENIDVSTKIKLIMAIRFSLAMKNPKLNNRDIIKISTERMSLKRGETRVTLTITSNEITDTIDIFIWKE